MSSTWRSRTPLAAGALVAAGLMALVAPRPSAAAAEAPVEITVVVPADAEVFFDGNPTSQAGTERLFISPPLAVGKKYHYDVRARWREGGRAVEQTRKVEVSGGGRVRVDFTTPLPQDGPKGGGAAAGPRVPAGTSLAETGMLLRRQGADGKWQVVTKGETLYSGDLLVGLAGAVIESKDKGVELQLQADYDSPLPLQEPGVILHAENGYDLDFTLDRGRVDFTNRKKQGPARVRARAWGEDWEVGLDAPGSSVAVELVGRWRQGSHFNPKPGPRDIPSVDMLFLVLAGEVTLKHRGTQYAMTAPPGPALLGWNNFVGADPGPRHLDKLPPWAGRETDPAVKERMEKMREIRQRLIAGFASKSPGEVIDELLNSDDPFHRRVGVIVAGALDDLPRLARVLNATRHQDVWDQAVVVLRHWLGRAPGQDQDLYLRLIETRGFTPVQAETVLEFLFGFSEDDLGRPETYQMLIDYLADEKLAIRGLAYWHLIRLVPEGKSIPYHPLDPKEAREKARQEWKKLIPPGKMPPKEKVKP
jgi:uncharacterized protein (TIGR03000 family)